METLTRDLMASNVVTVSPFATLREALGLMKQHGIKSLVVERQTDHDAYGLLTYTNILKTITAEQGDIDLINVYDICVKPAIEISPHLAVRHAAALMTNHKLKRVLVTDNNALCGILTMDDIVGDILRLID